MIQTHSYIVLEIKSVYHRHGSLLNKRICIMYARSVLDPHCFEKILTVLRRSCVNSVFSFTRNCFTSYKFKFFRSKVEIYVIYNESTTKKFFFSWHMSVSMLSLFFKFHCINILCFKQVYNIKSYTYKNVYDTLLHYYLHV